MTDPVPNARRSPMEHERDLDEPIRTPAEALEAERAELVAENEAAASWGAAVGARLERIRNIERQLAAPSSTPSVKRGRCDE